MIFLYLSQPCNMFLFLHWTFFSSSILTVTGIVTDFLLLLLTEASYRFLGVIFPLAICVSYLFIYNNYYYLESTGSVVSSVH